MEHEQLERLRQAAVERQAEIMETCKELNAIAEWLVLDEWLVVDHQHMRRMADTCDAAVKALRQLAGIDK